MLAYMAALCFVKYVFEVRRLGRRSDHAAIREPRRDIDVQGQAVAEQLRVLFGARRNQMQVFLFHLRM